MGKVYVFAIGGTGARVSRALTNLLITKDVKDTEFVTVFFDNDLKNGDLNRTISSVKSFNEVDKSLGLNESKINLHSIELLSDKEASQVTFGTYIGYDDKVDSKSRMESMEKLLIESLYNTADYTDKESFKRELHLNMKHGFKGRPNIGSIVFNNLKNKSDFQTIIGECASGNNKIVIVNSLFGGTGASGLPQLIQIFKDYQREGKYSGLENIPICAISFFPYYHVERPTNIPNPDIDSSTWMTKAKSAAKYYIDNITRLNCMYSFYDNQIQSYKYNDGGEKQINPAHWIELMGALSIVEFAENKNITHETRCNNILISKSNENDVKSSEKDFTIENLQKSINDNYIKFIQKIGLFWFIGNYYFNLKSEAPFIEAINDKYKNDINKFKLNFDYLNSEFKGYIHEIQTNRRALLLLNFVSQDPYSFLYKESEGGWIAQTNLIVGKSDNLKAFLENFTNYILKLEKQ